MIDVEELKRLHEAATPRPWRYNSNYPMFIGSRHAVVRPRGDVLIFGIKGPRKWTTDGRVVQDDKQDAADAELTSVLRNALPDIIAALTPAGGMELETSAEDRAAWCKRADDAGRLARDFTRLSTPPADVAGLVERLKCVEFFSDALMAARSGGDDDLIDKYRAERKEATTALLSLSARVKEVEAERDAWSKEVTDLTWQRQRADERAEAAEAALAELREKARTFNVTNGELLRIRNECEHVHVEGRILIGAKMLQMIVDHVRDLRAFLASLEKDTPHE